MPPQTFDVDKVPDEYASKVVNHVRVTIHTMGAVAEGAQLSQNHWTIELLLETGCVRLNMVPYAPGSETDRRGLLNVSYLPYHLSRSYVNYFDYQPSEQVKVNRFTNHIITKGRDRYIMTDTGVGCRHWVSVVIKDWQEAGLTSTETTQGHGIEDYIQCNWSKGLPPIQLPIREGSFY